MCLLCGGCTVLKNPYKNKQPNFLQDMLDDHTIQCEVKHCSVYSNHKINVKIVIKNQKVYMVWLLCISSL